MQPAEIVQTAKSSAYRTSRRDFLPQNMKHPDLVPHGNSRVARTARGKQRETVTLFLPSVSSLTSGNSAQLEGEGRAAVLSKVPRLMYEAAKGNERLMNCRGRTGSSTNMLRDVITASSSACALSREECSAAIQHRPGCEVFHN